jgi:hypothetical protein
MFETRVVSATQQENVISRLACSIRQLRACVLLQVFYPSPQYPLNGCRGLSLLRLRRRKCGPIKNCLWLSKPRLWPGVCLMADHRLLAPVSEVSIVVELCRGHQIGHPCGATSSSVLATAPAIGSVTRPWLMARKLGRGVPFDVQVISP